MRLARRAGRRLEQAAGPATALACLAGAWLMGWHPATVYPVCCAAWALCTTAWQRLAERQGRLIKLQSAQIDRQRAQIERLLTGWFTRR